LLSYLLTKDFLVCLKICYHRDPCSVWAHNTISRQPSDILEHSPSSRLDYANGRQIVFFHW